MPKARNRNALEPIVEVIACSVADALAAQRGGASRLEIIRDFDRGGMTPSLALVQEILDAVTLPVRVMLRERESYEVTSDGEIEKMCSAAKELSRLKVDGVVLGFLRNGEIDLLLTERVLSCAPNLDATFHHAFEEAKDPIEAIRDLKQLKQVDRILTNGGPGEWMEKVVRLSRVEAEAGPEIKILAGGGIDQQSLPMICRATGIREFHVGRAAREPATARGTVKSERVSELVKTVQRCRE